MTTSENRLTQSDEEVIDYLQRERLEPIRGLYTMALLRPDRLRELYELDTLRRAQLVYMEGIRAVLSPVAAERMLRTSAVLSELTEALNVE